MTQAEEILEWLQSGRTLTALEALEEFGCFRLAARIFDLKNQGHEIFTEDHSYLNYKGVTKTIAKYWMDVPQTNQQMEMGI